MKLLLHNSKLTQTASESSRSEASAGPDGTSIAPPAYGIESIDRALAEFVPEPRQEQLPGPPVQMKADVSAAGSDAGAKPQNKTGLPHALKSGVESLSGLALDDVRVHYNSSKPAQLQAFAYAQGTDIHLGPGQERHLPHEAWHVVQQKQGRVRATRQLKGARINDDTGLEKEANSTGFKSCKMDIAQWANLQPTSAPEPLHTKDSLM